MNDNRKSEVTIREFQVGDEDAFRRLNEEWITRFFVMEEKDRYTLLNPHKKILAPGGKIFFAVYEGELVGCCALLTMCPGEYEVAKMAVTPSAQGLGIGKRVLASAIEAAKEEGATRLYLETNHALTPAIHLYESLGFQHLPPERVPPTEYVRADIFMELAL